MNSSPRRIARPGFLALMHLVVILLYVAFLLMSSFLMLQPESIVAVFAVAGTMVALVLPAAGLLGEVISRTFSYWLERFYDPAIVDKRQVAKDGLGFMREARRKGEIAWRASNYILASLILSTLSLFSYRFDFYGYSIPLTVHFVDGALAFLIAGSALFYPVAKWIYHFRSLSGFIGALELAAKD